MNEELNNNNYYNSFNSKKALLVPIMSIAVFVVLIFAAGYAYYTMAVTNATANGNITTPKRPALTCVKTDGSVSIPLANMVKAKNGNIAGTTQPKLTCTCAGAGKCIFNVNMQPPASFTVLQGNEVTMGFNTNINISPDGTKCVNKAATNWAAGLIANTCTLPAGSTVLITGTINFYNINADQSSRADKTFVFTMKSEATPDSWSP